jgi:hypothetical protein
MVLDETITSSGGIAEDVGIATTSNTEAISTLGGALTAIAPFTEAVAAINIAVGEIEGRKDTALGELDSKLAELLGFSSATGIPSGEGAAIAGLDAGMFGALGGLLPLFGGMGGEGVEGGGSDGLGLAEMFAPFTEMLMGEEGPIAQIRQMVHGVSIVARECTTAVQQRCTT